MYVLHQLTGQGGRWNVAVEAEDCLDLAAGNEVWSNITPSFEIARLGLVSADRYHAKDLEEINRTRLAAARLFRNMDLRIVLPAGEHKQAYFCRLTVPLERVDVAASVARLPAASQEPYRAAVATLPQEGLVVSFDRSLQNAEMHAFYNSTTPVEAH